MDYIYSTKEGITVAGYPILNHLGDIYGGGGHPDKKKNLVIPVGLVIVQTSTNIPFETVDDDLTALSHIPVIDDEKFDDLFSMCGEIEHSHTKKKNTSRKKK